MAKFKSLYRHFLVIQLIFLSINILSIKGDGSIIGSIKKYTGTVARSAARVPSKVMDGGQYATHKVAGGIGRLVSPVRPLETLVHVSGGVYSNAFGTLSRLMGKTVESPQRVMFLYDRPMEWLTGPPTFQDAVKMVIGHALSNVVLHPEDMEDTDDGDDGGSQMDLRSMPVLDRLAKKLKDAGAPENDVRTLVKLLGRNGRVDLPVELETKVLGVFKNKRGIFRNTGVMTEMNFIANHLKGFYKLNDHERTDYKLNTYEKYSRCTVIKPPIQEDMVTE